MTVMRIGTRESSMRIVQLDGPGLDANAVALRLCEDGHIVEYRFSGLFAAIQVMLAVRSAAHQTVEREIRLHGDFPLSATESRRREKLHWNALLTSFAQMHEDFIGMSCSA